MKSMTPAVTVVCIRSASERVACTENDILLLQIRCVLYLLITLPFSMISAHTTMSNAPSQLIIGALWER